MRRKVDQKGSIMVEAALYIPVVFSVIMALLYLALFNMQEYFLLYEVQRASAIVSREEAYLGYEEFGMGENNEIDFSQGSGVPSADKVKKYYEAYFSSVSRLYRELGYFGAGSDVSSYGTEFANDITTHALISMGTISSPEISVKTGFLGSNVTVTITHTLPMPGILEYLGYESSKTIRTAGYTYSVNSTEFVRNVDFASDLVAYIFEKFGLGDKYKGALKKIDEVVGKIL